MTDSNFDILLENSHDLIFILDSDSNIQKLNSNASNIFGWTIDKVEGQNFYQRCKQDDIAIQLPNETSNEPVSNKIKCNNSQYTISWKTIETKEHMFIIGKDISQREHFHDVINQQQACLDSILLEMPGHVYWKDLNGVYLGCNNKQAQSVGLADGDDVVGKTDYDLVWKDSAPEFQKNDQYVTDTGKSITVEEKGVLASGRTINILSKKTPLRDHNKKIIGVLGISFDITDRFQYEQRLLAEREKYINEIQTTKKFLENMITCIPGNVYWLDTECRHLGCNNNNLKLFQFNSVDEIIGMSDFELMKKCNWSQKSMERFHNENMQVINEGIALLDQEDAPVIDPATGKLIYFLTSRVPIRDENNNIMGVIGVSLDITKRKEMEVALRTAKDKAEVLNKAKSEFVANISHDLRTPLFGILGNAELLMAKLENKKLERHITEIDSSANTLLTFVGEILDFNKLESGKLIINKVPFDLYEILKDLFGIFLIAAKKKNLELKFNFPNDLSHYYVNDPRYIRRILLNLLDNAIKFTEKGSVEISVTAKSSDNSGAVPNIQFCIKDTGVGIPDNKISDIFTRFERIQPSYKSTIPGTGLGLSIIKRLVIELDGNIHINSVVNKGSTFTVELPMAEAQQNEIEILENNIRDKQSKKPITKILKNTSVLLIEDEMICQHVVKTMLNDSEINVVTANSGATAIDALQKHDNFDLILMDIGLPDMTGMELASKIKEQGVKTPIVALTAHVARDDEQKYLNHGLSGFLTKPIKQMDLINAVTSFLNG